MAIRVIGAGLGRTGTLSLKAALEEIGFGKCYHMVELLNHPEQVHFWEAASAGQPVDWSALFDGYQASVDYPACRYYTEIMEYYPEARVVLTVRSPESWYESVRDTIYQAGRRLRESEGAPSFPFPGDPQLFMRIFGMVHRDIWGKDFQGRFEDRAHTLRLFQEHIETVKERVPAARLLVYEVKQGWEPLCEFLGVPVPEGRPFPRLNDRETFQARLKGH